MKKKILIVFAALFIALPMFSQEKEVKTVVSFEPLVYELLVTDGVDTLPIFGFNDYGFHVGVIYDNYSFNFGIKGFATDVEADFGYNLIKNDYFVMSLGLRAALDSWTVPGIGVSDNMDVFIPLCSNMELNIGLGAAVVWYPTMGQRINLSNVQVFNFEFTPRIGVSFKN